MSDPNSTTQARQHLSLAIGSQQTAHDAYNEANARVVARSWTTTAEVHEVYERRRAAHELYMAATRFTNAAADRYVAVKFVPVTGVPA
ncbi:hypothetical protein [Rhodococcoides fascians]|uniref:hypothetical protein n=1 Tax=Rhodococcoides fascians TaxID=1828 RepID=UPI00050BFC56|nr:hypothetical protein [Rhodococcus fascians]